MISILPFVAGVAVSFAAAYLRIGRPYSLSAPGALLSGSPYQQFTEVAVPPRARADDQLWLTVEAWDGSVHQASLPLAEASPSLVAWLDRQGASR